MLVPRSIDPSCVISPAFEGSPGYIYTALAASYSRSLRHMNQTVCADDVTLETANTSVALTSRGEPTELVSQIAPITEERDLKRKKKKKKKRNAPDQRKVLSILRGTGCFKGTSFIIVGIRR